MFDVNDTDAWPDVFSFTGHPPVARRVTFDPVTCHVWWALPVSHLSSCHGQQLLLSELRPTRGDTFFPLTMLTKWFLECTLILNILYLIVQHIVATICKREYMLSLFFSFFLIYFLRNHHNFSSVCCWCCDMTMNSIWDPSELKNQQQWMKKTLQLTILILAVCRHTLLLSLTHEHTHTREL